jgi:sec-independent protein translocase protein TatB
VARLSPGAAHVYLTPMFDFAWSEIALIAFVALVLIGPKDMPVAAKALADVIKKARRMAGEFQTHVDEMMREANLQEVQRSINEIRNFDFRGEVERTIDPDRTIRDTFAGNPLDPVPIAPAAGMVASETIHAPPPEPTALPTWFVPAPEVLRPDAAPFLVQHLGPAPPAETVHETPLPMPVESTPSLPPESAAPSAAETKV